MSGPLTLLGFVSHASVVVRYGDHWVLTDPWFLSPAFSSWSPTPPPFVNPAIWPTLARSGKLALLLSHAHGDHADAAFLRTLPAGTPCFIPRYADRHFPRFLAELGLTAVTEIETETRFGPFAFRSYPHHDSATDSAQSLETPDAFLLHANDSFELGAEALALLHRVKPPAKADLFLGQGGSASGHPLTYSCYPEEERTSLLREKNTDMARRLAGTATRAGFRRALAYACFASVHVEGKRYSTPTAVTGSDLFLDLSPGDLYVPAEDRVLSLFGSLHWDWSAAPPLPALPIRFPDVPWTPELAAKARAFLAGFEASIERETDLELAVRFRWQIVGPGSEPLDEIETAVETARRKTCRVSRAIAAAVLRGDIPFEDLYTGYLATWSREPVERYNRRFLQRLLAYGYDYQLRARFEKDRSASPDTRRRSDPPRRR